MAAVRPAERHLHHQRRHDLRRPTPSQVPTPARTSCPGIKKGIRIGSAKDGTVTAFIEDMESTVADHSGAEGVGVDAQGNVYGAVVRRQMLERHVLR